MREYSLMALEDICLRITDGSHFSPSAQSFGYPMYSVKDMTEYGFSNLGAKKISEDDYQTMVANDCVPKINDLLVAKDGSLLKHIFVCKEGQECAILSSIALFRPDTNIVDPYYLAYLLKSPEVYGYMKNNCVSGSALPRIVLKAFKKVPLPIPLLDEQKKIAAILSSLDDKIETNRAINARLEELAAAIFKSWFIDFEPFADGEFIEDEYGRRPKGWDAKPLSYVANYLNGLAMQKYPVKHNKESLPVLKIKELGQGYCSNDSDYCSAESIGNNYIINNGDVIFSWSGTLMVRIWTGGKCGLNQHLFKVTSDYFPKWFIYLWTKSHNDKFIRIAKDKAVTMGHIKRGELDKAITYIPPKDVFEKIDKIITPIIEEYITLSLEASHLASLRNTLLPRLMLGELIPE